LPPAPAGKSWQLLWSDEFDGTKIDTTKWRLEANQRRKTGYWSRSAVTLDGKGNLVITSTMRNGSMITGAINTRDLFETTYGYFVARCKASKVPGALIGFWLQSKKISVIGDPSHPTEIDILELPTRDGKIHHNLHWGGYKLSHKTTGTIAPMKVDIEQYHDYGVWWSPLGYKFYVDGQLTWTTTAGGISSGPEYMRLSGEPMILNTVQQLQVMAAHQHQVDKFFVDYVRVYQLK
jgi:beta-glucanase (GH16 family)